MNPHKMNKVDISAMSEQEQKAFKMYGKMPAKNLLTKMQKDRKYFDSGDYMMNKAGVGNAQPVGTAIPTPEGVPHASPPGPNSPGILSSSPTGSIPSAFGGPGEGINASANAQAQPIGVPGQPNPFHPQHRESMSQHRDSVGAGMPTGFHPHHRDSVGVGISPAATSEAMEVPSGGHARRPSESHGARISPPATMRDGANTSSFPIQHHGGFGSSPVKASSLARRVDQDQ